ncbi:MAG: hypothetical protein HQL69_23585 [Magnetococcales bacterium]|nr:hypothetical protein [Magnetococcales bacterium]
MTPTLSRLLAITLVLVIIKLSWSLLIAPYKKTYHSQQEQIASTQKTIKEAQQKSAQQEQLENIKKHLEDTRGSNSRVFTGESASIIAAKLQDIVKSLVESNGSTQTSSQILRLENINEFQKLGVKIKIETNLRAIRKIFYELENYSKLLIIDKIEIVSRDKKRTQNSGVEGLLKATFSVYAFMTATIE